jgi:hypothetical protein
MTTIPSYAQAKASSAMREMGCLIDLVDIVSSGIRIIQQSDSVAIKNLSESRANRQVMRPLMARGGSSLIWIQVPFALMWIGEVVGEERTMLWDIEEGGDDVDMYRVVMVLVSSGLLKIEAIRFGRKNAQTRCSTLLYISTTILRC